MACWFIAFVSSPSQDMRTISYFARSAFELQSPVELAGPAGTVFGASPAAPPANLDYGFLLAGGSVCGGGGWRTQAAGEPLRSSINYRIGLMTIV